MIMKTTTKRVTGQKTGGKLAVERSIYIVAPRKRVWRALTAPLETPNYYYKTRLETKLRRGEPFRYLSSDGELAVDGELVSVEPESKLVHTLSFPHLKDPATRVTYELSDCGPKMTKLDLVHDGFAKANETWKDVQDGWTRILSSLKTYIETGKGIDWPPGMGK